MQRIAREEAERRREEEDGGGPMTVNEMDEFGGARSSEGDPEDVDAYLVGAIAVVWENEVYTYGGLAPEGEFVTAVTRWSGRGLATEIHARAADPKVGTPPGRYGHSAVVVKDQLYVFGGQGQFGCLDDLWVFDFEACAWSLVRVEGAPPSPRTGHCACVSDNVMFVFGGRDVRPGMDAVTYDDLYGFDLTESEWLTVETKWKRPVGGDGCAMASTGRVLYVLSPSETAMEMLVWCLQLSAHGVLRWMQVPRAGQLPTPRTDYVACQYGANWVIHGGRVLMQDGALGDTHVFHFPTAEWGRLDPESDTDPRFGHAGSTVDGALVLLHGKRDTNAARDPSRDTGVCVAVNLEEYIMFPDDDAESLEDAYAFSPHERGFRSGEDGDGGGGGGGGGERGGGPAGVDLRGMLGVEDEGAGDLAGFDETASASRMNSKALSALNKKGVTGHKGGLLGGSLHAGRKGSHPTGDVELVAGNVKLHAHRDVIEAASPGLSKLMELRPIAAALRRKPDLLAYALGVHPVAGQAIGVLLHLLHVLVVVATFSLRAAVLAGTGSKKPVTLVFPDMRVPVLVAMLRWIYRIPAHPGRDLLVELHDAGEKYDVEGLPAYCAQRMRTEMCAEIAAGAARVARERREGRLWKAAVRCGQLEWGLVRYSEGMAGLVRTNPEVAKAFTLAVHDTISAPDL